MRLFGKKNQDSRDVEKEELLNTVYDARNKVWNSVGSLDSDVVAPIVNPGLAGMPMWPNLRQAYIITHLENGGTIIATDGLSDPFMEDHPKKSEKNGFELEFYILTDEIFRNSSDVSRSWQLSILVQLGLQTAHFGNMRELLDKYTYASIEVYDTSVPDVFKSNDKVGVLLGIESSIVPESIELPRGSVKLVSVVLLTPEETMEAAKGPEQRNELAQKLKTEHQEPISSIS